MKKKLTYLTCGYACLLVNILLVDSRFNIIGLLFGIISAVYFIKSLRIKK